MNAEPPPFGDPTRVDRDNSSAVRKGILFGCGGCAALVALMGVVFAGFFVMVFGPLRNSDACQKTLEAAQASEIMRRGVGEPMEVGWLVSGNISVINGDGSADMNVPIKGPAGEATVHTVATKKDGGPWSYSKMEATISKTGQKVNLR